MRENESNAFLFRVAGHLWQNHGGDLEKVTVVLPGKRAGLYLKKHIAAVAGRTTWLPQMVNMGQWPEYLTGKRIASNTELALGLYECLRAIDGAQCESFDRFLKWGFTALSDFNQAEQQLADTKKLFRDLRDVKEIEHWSLAEPELSAHQSGFVAFWKKLGELHEKFCHWQTATECFSSGLLLKMAAENLEAYLVGKKETHFVFAGLHGLNRAEEKIIFTLLREKLATVFWDADDFYVNSPEHEAGFFLRQYKTKSETFNWSNNELSGNHKSITIHQASSHMSMVAGVGEILSRNTEEWNSTAVVLADENLAGALLRSLPESNVAVNVTLGYPLRQSDLYSFLMLWLDILCDNEEAQELKIHFSQFMHLVAHPVWKQIAGDNVHDIRQQIRSRNAVMLSRDMILEFDAQESAFVATIDMLFPATINCTTFMQAMKKIVGIVHDNAQSELLAAAAMHIRNLAAGIDALMQQSTFTYSLSALKTLFKKLAGSEVIPLAGEPLGGLQVMGMLETRALDFEHVVVVGASEGVLPGAGNVQSFIPDDLRRIYQLPVREHSDAMYAYNFYRLLQRAVCIDLFYSTHSPDFSGAEKSRFISQLEFELPAANPEIEIAHRSCSFAGSHYSVATPAIAFDDYCRGRLESILLNGISPSAINTFIRCPLDFYYRYIVGLGEKAEVEETIVSATLGSVAHLVLEEFFRPHIGSFPGADDFEKLRIELPEKVTSTFSKAQIHNIDSGQNYLTSRVVIHMLEKFLQHEIVELNKRNSGKKLIAVEHELHHVFQNNKKYAVKGKADRIEMEGNTLRIIDYKSGVVNQEHLKIEAAAIESLFSDPAKSKALQLMLYLLMYCRSQSASAENCRAGIFSFPRFSNGTMWLHTARAQFPDSQCLNRFEVQLSAFIDSMFALQHFQHRPESAFCEYCNG